MKMLAEQNLRFLTHRPLQHIPPTPIPIKSFQITAIHAVDGDGFWAQIGNGVKMVRLLGLDAPELMSITPSGQRIGLWAKAELNSLIESQLLWAHPDSIQPLTDRFSRLLLWVWRVSDGTFINQILVQIGAARTRPDFKSNYTQHLHNIENHAKSLHCGIWKEQ